MAGPQWGEPHDRTRRERLPNGNTLVSLSDPGEIVEVDRSGKIVRSIAGTNMDIQFGWASGFAILPDGGC